MSRRTSVILDDDIYEKLVEESLKRYGTPRAISRLLNELLREQLSGRGELPHLIYPEKLARTTRRSSIESRRSHREAFKIEPFNKPRY